MKVLVACFLLIASVQAVDWAKVRPIFRTRPSSKRISNGRIVGGEIASPGQFPYQVGLFLDGSGFCGGSLVDRGVVMTAAHCVDGFSSFEVHFGAHNIYDESEPTRVIMWAREVVAHKDYDSKKIDNDIAVLKLPSQVNGAYISPVRLPSYSQVGETFNGETVRVSGWGRTSDSSPGISSELKFVDLTVITNEECGRFYIGSIDDTKICTDTSGGTASTCNGDSGGPLVVTELDGEYTIIGIVSFGSSLGCESGWPAAFTRVTEFLTWIETNGEISIRP